VGSDVYAVKISGHEICIALVKRRRRTVLGSKSSISEADFAVRKSVTRCSSFDMAIFWKGLYVENWWIREVCP
jgi:hypothetical protein